MLVLETERFVLRTLKSRDLPTNYFEWLSDIETIEHLYFEKSNSNRSEIFKYVDSHDDQDRHFLGIYTKKGHVIGTHSLRIDRQASRFTIGVMIGDKNFWGQGVTLETRATLLDYGFQEQGCVKAEGGCSARNYSAIFNYMKQGWTQEGIRRAHITKDENRIDFVLFGLLRERWFDK